MRVFIAAVAALFIVAAASATQAQQAARNGSAVLTADDSAALSDARIAALKVGLKLNEAQQKDWPPFESAIRASAKQRVEQIAKLRAAAQTNDPIALLRARADAMTASAASTKALADAAEPLYKTLDDGQKRRMLVLMSRGGRL